MRDKYNKSLDRFIRVIYGFIALFLIIHGTVHVISGMPIYNKYEGGSVLGSIMILAGLILLYAVVFWWRQFRDAELYNNKKQNEEENKNDLSRNHKH